jgi:acyl-CoA synthetase (AMP-forming)/AMP-acid ligase II
MTEASHRVSSNPLPIHGLNKASSAGLPTGVEIRIVAEDGSGTPPGGVGEIWIRGATFTRGESDAICGEAVQVAVILRPGMQAPADELLDYLRTKLSAFKVPERIYLVAEFPRTPKGSTDRRALAMEFAAGDAPPVGVRRENDVSLPSVPRGGPEPQ